MHKGMAVLTLSYNTENELAPTLFKACFLCRRMTWQMKNSWEKYILLGVFKCMNLQTCAEDQLLL